MKVSAFFSLDMSRNTLAAAMNFLAHTDALIIDLRNSGGGDVAMTELFTDYFSTRRRIVALTASDTSGKACMS